MPAQAITDLSTAAGPDGVASTDTLAGVHIELDRRKPGEERLAVAQKYQHPDRRLIERICADLGWPPATVTRSNRYAGTLRITLVTHSRKEVLNRDPGGETFSHITTSIMMQPRLEPQPGPAPVTESLPPPEPASVSVRVCPPDPDPVIPAVPILDGTDLNAHFARFHQANPGVYLALRDAARRLIAQGETRIFVKQLYEDLRRLARTTGETYRLNNTFTSRYARLLDQEPGLSGKIELRKLRS